ncbi:MAG: NAD-dependent deacylase [Crocinitomicaceae bacterium]
MENKKTKLVVLTGAGISAESGLGTFRDKGGLWDQYKIEEVATPEAWEKDPQKVLDFYNVRREMVIQSQPNKAHYALAKLEAHYDVQIVTQNIDDLHERAGSTNVLHLHGEILKSQCSVFSDDVCEVNGTDIKLGQLSKRGHQLRPNVVWFGEAVPRMFEAEPIVSQADIFIVVGTSLSVYPAANLLSTCNKRCTKYIVDIDDLSTVKFNDLTHLKGKATEKVPELIDQLLQESKSLI